MLAPRLFEYMLRIIVETVGYHRLLNHHIRRHWRIENNAHWQLDTTFQEDRCTARRGFASENFSLIRKWVMNLLRIKRKGQQSLESMRLEAAWDKRYFLRLLS